MPEIERIRKAEERVGTTLRAKWHLDSLLGVGGMAAVYAGTHRNGMRGAVKVLDGTVGKSGAMRYRFLREGYLANKVNHPGAVRVIDDDETDDGLAFLVMELLMGSTLESLCSAGPLGPEEVKSVMLQVLETLAAAHAVGIVHRDIKPENIFVTKQGQVKLLDFGIARLVETSPSLTQSGDGTIGTPAFMSPEQARGRWDWVDAQSDLFSVGATMFTCLSGRLVHEDEGTIAELIAATFTKQAVPLRSVAPNVPADLAAVVDRALLLRKSSRWESAAQMRDALAGGPTTQLARPATDGSMVTSTFARPARRSPWLAVGSLLTVAFGAAAAFYAFHGAAPNSSVAAATVEAPIATSREIPPPPIVDKIEPTPTASATVLAPPPSKPVTTNKATSSARPPAPAAQAAKPSSSAHNPFDRRF